MRRFAQTSVSILGFTFGLFFCMVGTLKVYPGLVPDIQKQLVEAFPRHAEVSPLNMIGIKPDPATYMFAIGVAEIALGLLLIVGPPAVKLLSNILLLLIMVGAVHAHVVQADGKLAPAAVCFVGLGFRLLLATSFPTYAIVDDEDKKGK